MLLSASFGLPGTVFSKLSSSSCESRLSIGDLSKLSSGVTFPTSFIDGDLSEILSFSGVLMPECRESLSRSKESLSGVDFTDTSFRESSGVTILWNAIVPAAQISVSCPPSSLLAVTNILRTVEVSSSGNFSGFFSSTFSSLTATGISLDGSSFSIFSTSGDTFSSLANS